MKFFEWENQYVGEYDVFAVATYDEVLKFVEYFGTERAFSASFVPKDDNYYFLDTAKKTITPMPELCLAFGGQYNGYPPYEDEINNFQFELEEYELTLFQRWIKEE